MHLILVVFVLSRLVLVKFDIRIEKAEDSIFNLFIALIEEEERTKQALNSLAKKLIIVKNIF